MGTVLHVVSYAVFQPTVTMHFLPVGLPFGVNTLNMLWVLKMRRFFQGVLQVCVRFVILLSILLLLAVQGRQ